MVFFSSHIFDSIVGNKWLLTYHYYLKNEMIVDEVVRSKHSRTERNVSNVSAPLPSVSRLGSLRLSRRVRHVRRDEEHTHTHAARDGRRCCVRIHTQLSA